MDISAVMSSKPPPLPIKPLLAAAVLMAVLLLLFGLVLQQGVREAAVRNADNAARADALWRCQVGRDRPGRQGCVQQSQDSVSASR